MKPFATSIIPVLAVGAALGLFGAELHSPAGAAEFQVAARSIGEIADGAMPTVTDVSATNAVILFSSSIPLACSVVFGETRAFGQIALDSDMDGGAHRDHHPLLDGLKPTTEYFYRVQGTAPDGTLYVGKVRSFVTSALPAGASTDLATKVAGARVVAVSSNYGGVENHQPWGADAAIDGSPAKAWSSAGDGDDAFIEIELTGATDIGEISVWSRSMSDGTARILTFQLTIDGETVLGPFELPDVERPHHFTLDILARRIRLDVVESTGGNVGLIEFEAFRR